jgi:hypothetical protein
VRLLQIQRRAGNQLLSAPIQEIKLFDLALRPGQCNVATLHREGDAERRTQAAHGVAAGLKGWRRSWKGRTTEGRS